MLWRNVLIPLAVASTVAGANDAGGDINDLVPRKASRRPLIKRTGNFQRAAPPDRQMQPTGPTGQDSAGARRSSAPTSNVDLRL